MSVIRVSFFLLCCLLASCASTNKKKIYLPDWFMFSLVKLQVVPSFDPPKIYEVSRHSPYWLHVSVYEGAGGYDLGGNSTRKTHLHH